MADVIIDREGSSGVGGGVILGILVAIVAIGFLVWYFGFNATGHGTTNINITPPQVQVSAPAAS